MSMRYSRQILFRFIVSFTIVMCIPFLFFTYMVSSQMQQRETEKAVSAYQEAASHIVENFDDFFTEAENVKLNLMEQKYFFNFYLKQNGGAFVYLEDYFKKMGSQNSLFYYTYFYSRTTDQFYGISTFDRNRYFERINLTEESVRERFVSLLDTSGTGCIPQYPASINNVYDDFVTFVIPFEYENMTDSGPCSCVILNIRSDTFQDFCQPVLLFEGTLVTVRYHGNTIWANSDSLIPFDPRTTASTQKNGTTTCRFEDKTYLLISDQSSQNDLEIQAMIPIDVVQSTISSMVRLYLLISLAGLLIGCVLIYIFVKLNYTPIRKLDSVLLTARITPSPKTSYFETVSNTIQKLSVQNQMINQENLQIEKEKLLLKLFSLEGNGVSPDELKKTCAQYGIPLNFRFFVCFLCTFSELPAELEPWDNLTFPSQDHYALHACFYRENNCMIFLLCSNFESAAKADDIIMGALTGLFGEEIPPCRIGAGGFKRDPLLISSSYREAFSALGSSEEFSGRILHYRDIRKLCVSNIPLLMKESCALQRSILAYDPDKFNLSYHSILNSLRENANKSFCEIVCFDTISKCIDAVQAANLSGGHSFCSALNELTELNQNSGKHLACLDIFSEVMDEILNLISEAQPPETEDKSSKTSLDIDRILHVIHEKYLDSTFSAKELAAQFHTSASNISHLFKNKMGVTLSDYINNLKMDTVKKMLVETDYTISYISQYAGYYHTSNFIKKFKKTEGMTPNEYRTLHQKDREKK